MSPPFFLPYRALQGLFDKLIGRGYDIIAPQVRDHRIEYTHTTSAGQLPWGATLEQGKGFSQIHIGNDPQCFSWATGPQALKPFLFAPRESLWQLHKQAEGYAIDPVDVTTRPLAFFGARACDLAALRIQDQHFMHGPYPDPYYAARRAELFLVAVNCTHPAETCFCTSTGDGPEVKSDADLALTEIDQGFVVTLASPAGLSLLVDMSLSAATPTQLKTAAGSVHQAAAQQTRALPSTQLRDALLAQLDHARWHDVAERCLACGNCTAVCPTCFCHAEIEEASLDGAHSLHSREWDSCFGERHGYIHGKQLRPTTQHRYRQWLTHKLATWHDQFGRSGCVGCGRCIAWCPVGIDLTEEVRALLS